MDVVICCQPQIIISTYKTAVGIDLTTQIISSKMDIQGMGRGFDLTQDQIWQNQVDLVQLRKTQNVSS